MQESAVGGARRDDPEIHRDDSLMVEEGVRLDGAALLVHTSPFAQGQSALGRRGVEGEDGPRRLETEVLVGVQPPSFRDHLLGDRRVDPQVSSLVGRRKGVASHATREARVVELLGDRRKAVFDISWALPERDPCEGDARELVPARKASDSMVVSVALDESPKRARWQVTHQLDQRELVVVQPPLPVQVAVGCVARAPRAGR